MSALHVLVGIAGAVGIVMGAVWAMWPVADTAEDSATLVVFPYLVHGGVLSGAGLLAALWALHGVRRDGAAALAPGPPR